MRDIDTHVPFTRPHLARPLAALAGAALAATFIGCAPSTTEQSKAKR